MEHFLETDRRVQIEEKWALKHEYMEEIAKRPVLGVRSPGGGYQMYKT